MENIFDQFNHNEEMRKLVSQEQKRQKETLLEMLEQQRNRPATDEEKDRVRVISDSLSKLAEYGWFGFGEIDIDNIVHISSFSNGAVDKFAITYYSENNFMRLKDLLKSINTKFPDDIRIKEAETNFFIGNYLSCAVLLSAFIERIIRLTTGEMRAKVKCLVDGFLKINDVTEMDTEKKTWLRNGQWIAIAKPLHIFIDNLFANTDNFNPEKEQAFINRNWLVHGMNNRPATVCDCIQLFGVVEVIAIVHHLK